MKVIKNTEGEKNMKKCERMAVQAAAKGRKLYVAYGSNLNLMQMAHRCPTAKVLGKGMIDDYKLAFWGVATILEAPGENVPVGVWIIDKESEKALDIYEGFPNLYRKEWVDVQMYDGSVVKAMVYIMNYGKGSVPNRYYYNTIREGYEDVGLDEKYLITAYDESIEANERFAGL